MSIIRVKKTGNFSIIDNTSINDKNLDWECRGAMAYLLSKPDDWTLNTNDLINQTSAGEYKVLRILKTLEEHGYITRTKYRTEDGTYRWEKTVHERPMKEPETTPQKSRYGEDDGSIPRLSTAGSSRSGKPRDVLKTESPKTESPKTEKITSSHGSENGARSKNEEDKIRKVIEEHFCFPHKLAPPKAGTAKERRAAAVRWWQPIRELLDVCEWDIPETKMLIDMAVDQMDREGLTISAPQSILEVAKSIAAKAKRGTLRRSGEPKGFQGGREFLKRHMQEERP